MEYIRLGTTGTTVSRICLGCMSYGDKSWQEWVLSSDEAREHFKLSLDSGVNFFDTADVYSIGVSEEITGRHLMELSSRHDIVLATKVHGTMGGGHNRGGLSRKHILEACDASLRRLKTDFIDLYQIHRFDFKTPIEETLDALDSLVRAGKVRYLGASSMAAWQFQKMLNLQKLNGWHKFVTMQNHYNLVYREEEREMNPLCVDEGVGLLAWSPLARGFLAGNRKSQAHRETERSKTDRYSKNLYYTDDDFAVVDAVEAVAKNRGATPAQVALAWVLHAPGVTAPIVGATKSSQLSELFNAVEFKLSSEEIESLEVRYKPRAVLGHIQPDARRMLRK